MRKILQLDRNADRSRNKPLRTFREMAEEFGVRESTLKGLLSTRNGPKPELTSGSFRSVRNSWYDPAEMRRWWKSIQEPKVDA
jgi:hypothetical protein